MTISARPPLNRDLPRDTTQDAAAIPNLGELPEWDLSDLYPAPDAPELTRDVEVLETACAEFARDYEGRLAALDAAQRL